MTDWGRAKMHDPKAFRNVLDAAALWWAAAVVRHWRNITNRRDVETSSSQSAQCAFTTGAWTLHLDFKRFHAVVLRLFGHIFRSHLSRVRCRFP